MRDHYIIKRSFKAGALYLSGISPQSMDWTNDPRSALKYHDSSRTAASDDMRECAKRDLTLMDTLELVLDPSEDDVSPTKPTKFVQIAVGNELFALDADGQVWAFDFTKTNAWLPVSDNRIVPLKGDLTGLTGVVHRLKCHPHPFRAMKAGDKRHEIRHTRDRTFNVGDTIFLNEYVEDANPEEGDDGFYTGSWIRRHVTHVTKGGQWELPEDLVVMSVCDGVCSACRQDSLSNELVLAGERTS